MAFDTPGRWVGSSVRAIASGDSPRGAVVAMPLPGFEGRRMGNLMRGSPRLAGATRVPAAL